MKVVCIDTPKTVEPNIGADSIVIIGQRYTVNDETEYAYELVEHLGYGYAKRCFAPCSDIDETELLQQRQTQYA